MNRSMRPKTTRGGVGSNQYEQKAGGVPPVDRAAVAALNDAVTTEDLDAMAWAFGTPESEPWVRAGFHGDSGYRWSQQGFTVTAAVHWRDLIKADEPEMAARWQASTFTPEEAREVCAVTLLSPEEAEQLSAAQGSLCDGVDWMKRWVQAARPDPLPPAEAMLRWAASGVHPQDAYEQHQMDHDPEKVRAEWDAAEFGMHEREQWSEYFAPAEAAKWRNAGFHGDDAWVAVDWMERGISPQEAWAWTVNGVRYPEDYDTWVENGFTLASMAEPWLSLDAEPKAAAAAKAAGYDDARVAFDAGAI